MSDLFSTGWIFFLLGSLTTLLITTIKKAFDLWFEEFKDDRKRQREAARAVYEAAYDLQYAIWQLSSLHTTYYAIEARSPRDMFTDEQEILNKIGSALRAFLREYDLPEDLMKSCQDHCRNINLALDNLKSFSMTGQQAEMEQAARAIQEECTALRTDANRHAIASGRWVPTALRRVFARVGPGHRRPAKPLQ